VKTHKSDEFALRTEGLAGGDLEGGGRRVYHLGEKTFMNGTICLLFFLEWRERYFLWKSAHVSDFLLRSPPFRRSTMVMHFERVSDMRDCCEVIRYQLSTVCLTVTNVKEILACVDVKLSSASKDQSALSRTRTTDKNILR
jgi:hypothetical protein